MNTKISLSKILPVLMSFFVMSFVDLVGISVDRVSSDMDLSATLAQLIPMATFLWFFLLSVPVGIIQARYGKRFVLNAGMVLTAAGLLIPFISYSFGMVLAGFALIGIGNTIVQVSANPLLLDVVPSNRASSFLSFSQFVKAVGSMIGAPLAAVFASQFGDWKLEFLVFGIISLLAVIWLGSVKIEERKEEGYRATLKTSFGLLGNSYILMMVVAIFLVVGVDVGFNSNSGQFLMKHFGIEQTAAESGRSVYFFGRMLGTFLGAIMLTRIQAPRFLMWTTILSIASVAVLLVIPSKVAAWGLVFLTGLAVANIWPLIFSLTVGRFPERSSEISGLMIMAVSGGAPIPFLIGWISDMSNIVFGMSVLIVCLIYIFAVSVYNLKKI
ncbi:MAG TPA: MFS transporter [Bacteroidales bacterium]|nr:MFS transporter [Bacteroidales bacterium]